MVWAGEKDWGGVASVYLTAASLLHGTRRQREAAKAKIVRHILISEISKYEKGAT